MSISAVAEANMSKRAEHLRAFVVGLMVLMPVVAALIWLRPAGVHVEVHEHAMAMDPAIAATVATIFLEVALFELVRMLSLIAAGEYYSVRVVRHFRSFAFWLLILALIGFAASLVQPSRSSGVTIAIGINLTDLLAVGLTLLLFLIARLLEHAGEIEQENREIV
jgi:hypothetical protein